MAADSVTLQVNGLDQLRTRLAEIPRTLRRRVLRNALAAGAREVRDTARRFAPVLSASTALRTPFRRPGTVRDAIRVRTSKAARQAGDVGVFVNVRPLPGNKYQAIKGPGGGRRFKLVKATQRGARNPNDPYYWRWLEFGTRKMSARRFLRPAGDKLPAALPVVERAIGQWIDKVNASGNPSAT